MHALNRHRGVHLGLANMHALLAALPPSHYTPHHHPNLHIAGSNGKGSTATKLAAALHGHGLRVGLYTSPHLSTWRERLVVDGHSITEHEVCTLLPTILHTAAALHLPLTAFEAQTALALCWFHVVGVDVGVVECGLGGRLDATNVIPAPLVAVITSISLEHTAQLGPTLRHIAREKAGIVKHGSAVVVGPTVDAAVVRAVVDEAGGGELVQVSGTFDTTEAENAAVARAALAVIRAGHNLVDAKVRERLGGWSEDVIKRAMTARPPCRYERLTLPTTPPLPAIFDVGHNPAAFARLVAAVRRDYPGWRVRAVVGISADKDIAACMAELLPHVDAVHLIRPSSPRSASLEQLRAAVSDDDSKAKVVVGTGDVKESVEEAVRTSCAWNARRGAAEPEELLLVCGSFFIFRDVREALGLHYPTDPVDLNESSLQPKHDGPATSTATTTNAQPVSSIFPLRTSAEHRHNQHQLPLRSHLPSSSVSCRQQPIRSNSRTTSAALEAVRARERTTANLTLMPAGADYHRSCVLSLYRHMLSLARHYSSPLTVTPVQDLQREFRLAAQCDVLEARERLRAGRGQLAYLRTQVERMCWRSGDVVGEKDAVNRDRVSEPNEQHEQQQSQPSLSAGDARTAEFNKGYDRIFATAVAEEGGAALPKVQEKEVQRWVYDESGKVVELDEEGRKRLAERDGTVGGRWLSNSQGLTDEQYRRDRALKDRFSFRGPTWDHLRKGK